MTVTAIELNDSGVIVASDRTPVFESPGYAVANGAELLVGEPAYRQARVNPRLMHNAFWDQLSTESLPFALGPAGTVADLAAGHLGELWERVREDTEQVIFAVPATFTRQQLGLLLGIAEELAIPVRGMVDLATTVAEHAYPGCALQHLDIHLHRVVLTGLEQGEQLRRVFSRTSAETGLAPLYDVWTRRIADLFVRATRFDPRQRGECEQVLYDRLPGWLEILNERDGVEIELPSRDGTWHGINLEREQLVEVARAAYDRIRRLVTDSRDDRPVVLLLSHRLAGLPGFVASLGALRDIEVVPLVRGASALGVLRHAVDIGRAGRANVLTTALPWESRDSAGAQVGQERPLPTHLLYRGVAYSLGHAPFRLGSDPGQDTPGLALEGEQIADVHCSIIVNGEDVRLENHSQQGTLVNGRWVEGSTVLDAGDRIRLGDASEELQVIAVK